MGFDAFIGGNKGAIIFTVLLMLIGSVAYVATGNGTGDMTAKSENLSMVFGAIRFKAVVGSDGAIHLLANSKNNAMNVLKTSQGTSIPEEDSVVLGASEAAKVRGGNNALGVGAQLTSYFGINPKIQGILEKKDNILDEIAFLSASEYQNATGDETRVFAKLTATGVPNVFYHLLTNESAPAKFRLAQGNLGGYEIHNLDGSEYYPMIVGAKEAKLMREEKLFSSTGDPIRNFFGKNFIVVGVLEETNTSIDRMHFAPLDASQLK